MQQWEGRRLDGRELRFVGGRFDARSLSVDAVQEAASSLAAYQEVIKEIGAHLYRQKNPAARRLPNNFSDQLSLAVGRFRRGSLGLADVAPSRSDVGRLVEVENELFRDCNELLDRIIMEASGFGSSVTLSELPHELQQSVARIGAGLREDESLEIAHRGLTRSLDARTRLSLRPHVQEPRQVDAIIAGRVVRVDGDRSRAVISLLSEQWHDIEPDFDTRAAFENLREALEWKQDQQDGNSIIAARGRFDLKDARFERSAFLSEVRVLDEGGSTAMNSLLREIDAIAALEDGWYDGAGEAPHPLAIRAARRLAPTLAFYDLPWPHAFPIPDGGVILEWEFDQVSASIEFEESDDRGTVTSLNAVTDQFSCDEDVEITCEYVRRWLIRIHTAD